jgi:hypothetical protein
MPVVFRPGGGGGSGPGGKFTLCDLAQEVLIKVENRQLEQDRALAWLRDALIEISSNGTYRDDFVELEVLGVPFNLTAGIQEYDESNFLPVATDFNIATLDIRLWQDPPFNTKSTKLNPSHYQRTDESSSAPSMPSSWYRFGANIGFYPPPNLTYQTQARLLRFHPINDQDLCTTVILLPRDWNEILVLAAAERGFIELEEYEKAGQIHALLFGDPDNPIRPGIIAGRIKKRANEAWRQQKALRPVVRSMTNFRR